ncbi:MAG: nitroreductase family protein [Burkholderiaceae bacterium]|nr:nitroreductase family protein [Burkholderiaceae bacterium]
MALDLVALLEQRQTRRQFEKPLDDTTLGEILWLACRNRSARPSVFGPDQESRVHPSAGAMHPIHILLARETGPWLRYDPLEHALIELPHSGASAAAGRRAASSLVELEHGTLIGLVAEPGKTAAKYEHPESLVWRDAGVVLGYLSLMAEALGLAFCPLGTTGQPYLTEYLPGSSALQAVGLAVVSAA